MVVGYMFFCNPYDHHAVGYKIDVSIIAVDFFLVTFYIIAKLQCVVLLSLLFWFTCSTIIILYIWIYMTYVLLSFLRQRSSQCKIKKKWDLATVTSIFYENHLVDYNRIGYKSGRKHTIIVPCTQVYREIQAVLIQLWDYFSSPFYPYGRPKKTNPTVLLHAS